MVVPAQRVGQGVHRRHRGVGEGLAGEAGAQQHGLARLAVATVVHRLVEVGAEQAQRLAAEQVGQGFFLCRLVWDSMAWTMASMPVAAVTAGAGRG